MPQENNVSHTDVGFSVSYHYPVYFGKELFDPENHIFADFLKDQPGRTPHRCLFFIDQGVTEAQPQLMQWIRSYAEHHFANLTLVDVPRSFPGGEECKNSFNVCQAVIRHARRLRLCRHSYIVVIGGGAFLDAVGFAASLIHRGIRLIRFPTTVLSQNDSGIGVKNGVNLNGAKNFLGVFSPPAAVFNDFSLLKTLSRRDWINGMTEGVKVGLMKDRDFLDWICDNADRLKNCEEEATQYLIRRCAELHALHIAQGGDPFESGSKRPLDFGHWAGHKLESLSLHNLRHGEAVAIGMAIDLLYAAKCGFIDQDETERIIQTMMRIGLPVWDDTLEIKGPDGQAAILAGLEEFREHLGGTLSIPLPAPIGAKCEISHVEPVQVEDCISKLHSIVNSSKAIESKQTE